MRWRLHTFVMATAGAAALIWSNVGHSALGTSAAPPSQSIDTWRPPLWHPAGEALAVLEGADLDPVAATRIPGLRARAAFVYDLDSGEVLYERAPDNRLPVASLTKFVSGLAFAAESDSWDSPWCVTREFWPSRPGARSKFSTGECYQAWDLFGAAVVASDNRAAYGLAKASGLPFDQFISRMNEISYDLGLTQSTWSEPSGLEDDNLSSARDVAKAAIAVALHPTLSIAANAPGWWIERTDADSRRWLSSTVRLVGRKDLEVLAAKTGYTDTAGYCFAGVLETKGGRRLAVSILGAPSSNARWADVDRLLAEFGSTKSGSVSQLD